MTDENGEILPNGLWVDDINAIPDVLASVINEWVEDEISPKLYDEMDKTNNKYTYEEWEKNVKYMIEDIFNKRIAEFASVKEITENKIKGENS